MRIGIDVSQMAYEGTGVANYLGGLIKGLLKTDKKNEYILFYSSLRKNFSWPVGEFDLKASKNVIIKKFKFPPTILDILWNRLHIMPIEDLIGEVDIFISSDWSQPPTRKAKKATILYDLIVYKFPQETDRKIVATQKRKLAWVKKECDLVLCISEATKKDALDILGIQEAKLSVINPGI